MHILREKQTLRMNMAKVGWCGQTAIFKVSANGTYRIKNRNIQKYEDSWVKGDITKIKKEYNLGKQEFYSTVAHHMRYQLSPKAEAELEGVNWLLSEIWFMEPEFEV